MSPGATFLLKWLLVPAALAAAGYFLVGPRVGGPVAERAAKKIKHSGIADHLNRVTGSGGDTTGTAKAGTGDEVLPDPNEAPSQKSRSNTGPNVSVDVTPAGSASTSSTRTLSNRATGDPAAPPLRSARRQTPRSETARPAVVNEKAAEPPLTEDPAGVGAEVP